MVPATVVVTASFPGANPKTIAETVATPLEEQIIPGIKVDAGAAAMAGHPGEKITGGLDGLRERLPQPFNSLVHT